jgi:hypothetical protein
VKPKINYEVLTFDFLPLVIRIIRFVRLVALRLLNIFGGVYHSPHRR